VITAEGEPGFAIWFERGATTLWETWKDSGFTDSRNHQMYSNVLSWFFEVLLGVKVEEDAPVYEVIHLQPSFVKDLRYCKGSVRAKQGDIKIEWQREQNAVRYTVDLPTGVEAYYAGSRLQIGINEFIVEDK
jgi:alpha-L-rhamnosidase